jgi:hypothetical protein
MPFTFSIEVYRYNLNRAIVRQEAECIGDEVFVENLETCIQLPD